jgi:hypothetical protein
LPHDAPCGVVFLDPTCGPDRGQDPTAGQRLTLPPLIVPAGGVGPQELVSRAVRIEQAEVTITITPASSDNPDVVPGTVFLFGPAGTQFNPPAPPPLRAARTRSM